MYSDLENLNLSVRSYNCLLRGGINTVEKLIAMSEEELDEIDVWNNIIDNGYNLTTTVDPTSNENYTFGYYNNQWSWEPGYYQPNSYSADYYKARNAWRFVARKGVPFVQFEFSKS